MKIFITVGIFPPDIGGPASFVPKIAELLTENNNEVKVLCLSNKKHKDEYSYEVIRIMRFLPKIIRWTLTIMKMIKHGRKADLWFINGLPMESYVSHKLILFVFRKKIRTIRKIVGDWAWERGRNLELTEDSFDEFQNNRHSLHMEIAKFSRGWTAKKVDKILVPSEHLKGVVRKWGVNEERIEVIYNGTKIIKDTKRKASKNIRLISVGRLAPWKNIDVIIDSIYELNKIEANNYILTLVGDGPIRQDLEKLIKEKGLEEFVNITGQVSADKVSLYLNDADVYIQASGYEGLPHVILEAINHKLTVISTPIGGTNEILDDGKYGWILPLVNGKKPEPNELVKVIKEVERKTKKDNQIKKDAFEILTKQFNEDLNLNKYLYFINPELIKKKSQIKTSILLFGTTRYSSPLSVSDHNKFMELSNVASVNLLTYGDSNASYEESGVYFQNIREPKLLLLKYLKFYFFSINKIRKIIQEKNIMIVSAKDAFTGFPVVIAKKIFKDARCVKLVIESHGDYREMVFQQRKYFFENIYKVFVSKIGNFVINNSDLIRGVTPESIDLLTKGRNIPSMHFPAWVDNNIFVTEKILNQSKRKDIIFVGNIIPRKGVLFLLESFKEFSLNNSTSSFLLIGDTPNEEYFNECKEYIESYGLKDRIEFLGKIDQSEISTLMNKSKVLVLASSYEGLPRVLIEAGLCSLPSLAPNIDGIVAPFGKDGGTAVYNLDNSYEFLSNLNKLYNNDKYYSELAIKAYELSNKLSGKYTFANNWHELIKRVMR